MRVRDSVYYEGIRLFDVEMKVITDVTWDRFPTGEWTELQQIEEGE